MVLASISDNISSEPPSLSSLPDAPLTPSALEAIDGADGIRRAISPTWKDTTNCVDGPEEGHTDGKEYEERFSDENTEDDGS